VEGAGGYLARSCANGGVAEGPRRLNAGATTGRVCTGKRLGRCSGAGRTYRSIRDALRTCKCRRSYADFRVLHRCRISIIPPSLGSGDGWERQRESGFSDSGLIQFEGVSRVASCFKR
jgi:hypothetical protein